MADSFTFHGRTLRVGDRIGTRTITAVPDHKPWYRHWVGGYVETRCDCGRKRAASAGVLLGLRKRPGRLHVCRPAAPTIDDVTKDRARAAVSSAVASGLLVRPRHCSLCGKEARRIVGHHRNYAHPLAVVWCCEPCHMSEHAQARRSPSQQTAEPADNAA